MQKKEMENGKEALMVISGQIPMKNWPERLSRPNDERQINKNYFSETKIHNPHYYNKNGSAISWSNVYLATMHVVSHTTYLNLEPSFAYIHQSKFYIYPTPQNHIYINNWNQYRGRDIYTHIPIMVKT